MSAGAWGAAQKLETLCPDEAATRRAGLELARLLAAGDLVLLLGDLGSGKTVFVRGLAEGLGADPAEVASPTFALVHEYGPAGKPPVLVHADFYRLAEAQAPRDIEELGLEEARREGAVVAVEWPRPPFTELPAWCVMIQELANGARKIRIERQ